MSKGYLRVTLLVITSGLSHFVRVAGLVALMAAKAFGADSVAITDIKNDK